MSEYNWRRFDDIHPPIEVLLFVRYGDAHVVACHLHHVMREDGWVLPVLYDQSGNTLAVYRGWETSHDPSNPIEWRYAYDADEKAIEG
jgi:hypothetical protein